MRSVRTLSFVALTICLTLVLALSAVASALTTMVTTGSVNFRSSPSVDADRIRTVAGKTSVDVLAHDPTGWSRVKVGEATGYIKSEFLTIPAGSGAVPFRTTDGVNFRKGPSTDSDKISGISAGVSVDVLEHDPVGWSKIRYKGAEGFVRSDFLSGTTQSSQGQPSSATAPTGSSGAPKDPSAPATLRTTDGVNLRSGASTDSKIIRTISRNTAVKVIEYEPGGWSKVSVDGYTGFIKTDLLRADSKVELLEWSEVKGIMKSGERYNVLDVRTGQTFVIKVLSRGDHADVEPVTQADTDTILKTRNGTWSWAARPVWVTIGDHTVAASINGMPHDSSTIPNNGINGHFCMHFKGSTTSSTSQSYKKDLQNAVTEAWTP